MTDETKMVLDQIKEINQKLDRVIEKGCARASAYDRIEGNQVELFRRMTAVETAQAEGRGKLAIAILIAGAVWSVVCIWIGKRVSG